MDTNISASTWRALGLTVAATYMGLGTFAITCPVLAGKSFGLYPHSSARLGSASSAAPPGSNANPTKSSTAPPEHANADVANHAAAVTTSMALLGARDLSIGIALAKFGADGKLRDMGTLILSGMVLCVVDVYHIWRLRGPGWGAAFAAGAGLWVGIGVGLVQV
ncbi:uncharacterized protein Z520_09822 [Fonsecaea multimorphosa CBS 102226]|uniref:Uncharacterized protein n=1 Tax=Fonsecaea multimorphosa CBS 102226 TaxID=1442371 RepID=A0A0D2IBC3_9EURO|nr:uncharacterized protein Z520_09822 [Fonsecaea multimorphosa CBS 102226]KIX94436.1 hypothetical protein Z520_09822 [Fonsecaea multimorphosa CBS 102226]OAL20017.1 hypothetical protein AYO22_09167 [Fonsecaea multimorphosa]